MNRRLIRTAITLIALVILVLFAKFGSSDKPATAQNPEPAEPRSAQPRTTGSLPQAEPAKPPAAPAGSQLSRFAPEPLESEQIEVTLRLIASNGPFPHERDGIVFGNREGRLPRKPRGYYREYTVETPGASTRGARRIIRGQGGETYYTRDHYATFVRIDGGGSGDR